LVILLHMLALIYLARDLSWKSCLPVPVTVPI
jgi:hypothetical protein